MNNYLSLWALTSSKNGSTPQNSDFLGDMTASKRHKNQLNFGDHVKPKQHNNKIKRS